MPHYVRWPYWADHDVFATAARAWDRGGKPYRDTLGNNFPGTIYAFWVLGRLFGWGRPAVWYACDAGAVVLFGVTLLAWSRRRFGQCLPGVVGVLVFQSMYLGLDYAHAAQRDWHGPFLAVLGTLVAQAVPGRAGRLLAGFAGAAAFVVRPQTVLFLPASCLAACDGRKADCSIRRAAAEWGLALTAGLVLGFAPLAAAGVLGDFFQSVRLAAYGGRYNRVTPVSFLRSWVLEAATWRWWALAAATALLAGTRRAPTARTAVPWLVALAGASLYKPLSPVAHSYLDIPLEVVGAVMTAVLVGAVVGIPGLPPKARLAAVILALALGPTTMRPEFCVAGPTWRSLRACLANRPFDEKPPGYRHGSVATSAYYPWSDYRAVVDYLRSRTSPSTRVANMLRGDPALTSVADRPSAFPAESVAWLRMVRVGDEPRFVEALRGAGDAIVVWAPGEVGPDPGFRTDALNAFVRREFEPAARFGAIAIWRRQPRAD